MVVGQVVCIYPPRRGGIGTVAAEYTRRLQDRGIDVRVFEPSNLRPWYAWGNAALVPSLFWKLRNVDIIHLHYPFYGGDIFAWLASIVWHKPLVVTYHMRPKADGWLGWVFRLHRWCIEPLILSRAKRVFVSSREYAFNHGLSNSRKYEEMPFGVDTKRFFVGEDDAFRTEHGIDLATTVILFVGGLDDAHYFKGLDVLLDACVMLRNDALWTLVVVGSGNRRTVYEAQAEKLGIVHRVRFLGSVPYVDLPRAYRAADIHVLPSIDRSEAFGLVTLEAAASGLSSVVSDLPGMRRLVLHGKTGYCVAPKDTTALADALRNLLQHEGERERMGVAARGMVVAQYDIDTLMDRLIAVYQSL